MFSEVEVILHVCILTLLVHCRNTSLAHLVGGHFSTFKRSVQRLGRKPITCLVFRYWSQPLELCLKPDFLLSSTYYALCCSVMLDLLLVSLFWRVLKFLHHKCYQELRDRSN